VNFIRAAGRSNRRSRVRIPSLRYWDDWEQASIRAVEAGLIGREDVTPPRRGAGRRRAGQAVPRGHQHNAGLDRDHDGIACEQL
jgi:Excalibur calcium-binding domain